jgi:hypothetical protein
LRKQRRKIELSNCIRNSRHTGFITALLLFASILTPTLFAQDQIQAEAIIGFEGFARSGTWIPVRILLSNNGRSFAGEMTLTVPNLRSLEQFPAVKIKEQLELAGGSRKQFEYILPIQTISIPLKLELTRGDETILFEFPFQLTFAGAKLIAVLGRGRPLRSLQSKLNQDIFEPVNVNYPHPETCPTHWSGWDTADVVVLFPESVSLFSDAGLEALAQWVSLGGVLYIPGTQGLGPDIYRKLNDFLPGSYRGRMEQDDIFLPNLELVDFVPDGPMQRRTMDRGTVFYSTGLVDMEAEQWFRMLNTNRFSILQNQMGADEALFTSLKDVDYEVLPSRLIPLIFSIVYLLFIAVSFFLYTKQERRVIPLILVALVFSVFASVFTWVLIPQERFMKRDFSSIELLSEKSSLALRRTQSFLFNGASLTERLRAVNNDVIFTESLPNRTYSGRETVVNMEPWTGAEVEALEMMESPMTVHLQREEEGMRIFVEARENLELLVLMYGRTVTRLDELKKGRVHEELLAHESESQFGIIDRTWLKALPDDRRLISDNLLSRSEGLMVFAFLESENEVLEPRAEYMKYEVDSVVFFSMKEDEFAAESGN